MSKKFIVLVEDDPNDVELIRRSLTRNNIPFELIVANDGAEALALLLGQGTVQPCALPTLVLLDMNLPKVNGLEVLQQLRSNRRTRLLPIVIFTSSILDQDKLKAYELGANSYICKPIKFEDFAESVRQMGFYWLSLNEQPPQAESLPT